VEQHVYTGTVVIQDNVSEWSNMSTQGLL
jgi:hypothetical protein